jgi:hypothetical protein
MQKALTEIADEYEYEKAVGDDYFSPIGELDMDEPYE